MFLCEGCGRTFENLEHYSESHGFRSGPFEEWDGCPFCGESGAIEVEACSGCGQEIKVDDLFHGLCAACLKKRCTYDTALEYLQDIEQIGPFFCWLLNNGHEPDVFAVDLLDLFAEIYRRRKANDLLTNSSEFLESVQDFILEADGDFGMENFAAWLERREKNA